MTILCVGPMSENSVDAVIEISNELNQSMHLIASRRQIECEKLGGGYVNNWTTETFTEYVRNKDKNGKIILTRDHGGIGQINNEHHMDYDKALKQSMDSFKVDIDSGFNYLHIDPMIVEKGDLSVENVLRDVKKIHAECSEYALSKNKKVHFEIGTEEQKEIPLKSIDELEYVLSELQSHCSKTGFEMPEYVVVQTGSKVMETKNIGVFPQQLEAARQYTDNSGIIKAIKLCEKFGVKIKEHNVDYSSFDSLVARREAGIHACNVAPEFGVCETNAIMNLLEDKKLYDLKSKLVDLIVCSGTWEKWAIDKEALSSLNKAIIAGHYIFSTNEFKEIKKSLNEKVDNLDAYLKQKIKTEVFRYLRAFGQVDDKYYQIRH